jgi:hypothetical protein
MRWDFSTEEIDHGEISEENSLHEVSYEVLEDFISAHVIGTCLGGVQAIGVTGSLIRLA